jgi:DNA polymerase III sliding clamp (beta) subunit (PCNA family)
MQLELKAGYLREGLNKVRQIIPTTPSMTAYSGVLMVLSESEGLRLVASDGDSSMSLTLDVLAGTPGQVLVQPRPLLSLLGSIDPDTNLTFAVTNSTDIVISGPGINPYTFRPLSASFPLPTMPAPGVRPSRMDDLLPALQAVRAATGRDSNAVQVVSDDDQLALHATDGYRLSRVVLPGAGFGTFTGVLPLSLLERVARNNPTEVTVDLKGRILAFRGENVIITARLLSVPFPAVDAVLSAAPPVATSLDPRSLLRALSRISAVAEQGTISVEFSGSQMHIKASTAELGSGHEVVDLTSPVPGSLTMTLRAPYLQDAAAAAGDGPVNVAYSGSLQPLFLTAQSPLSVTHVVMPVRG